MDVWLRLVPNKRFFPKYTSLGDVANTAYYLGPEGDMVGEWIGAQYNAPYQFLILKHLFSGKARLWCRNKFPVRDILDSAVTLYQNGNLEKDVK